MQYSQPFGVPPAPIIPPTRPPDGSAWPRYVNGNPVTGTAGSIPPNTAFDEDQLEIVNVIINAGLTPSHSDVTQLWQSLMALFAQKYITTAIIKTVHGSGADFPDLIAALNWLGEYIITPSGSVTFMVAAGKWTYTNFVELNHPNINRVTIQGAALLGAAPVPGNISVTGYKSATDGTNQIIYLRSVFATELSFTGGVNGFNVYRGGATLRYLLITGSQTVALNQGIAVMIRGADLNVDCLAVWGFGNTAFDIMFGALRAVSALSITCCYNGWWSINLFGGTLQMPGTGHLILASSMGAINVFASSVGSPIVDVRGHNTPSGNTAVQGESGSQIAFNSGSNYSINNQTPIVISGRSTFQSEQSTYQNNVGDGIDVYGGLAWVDDSTFSGNSVRAITCGNGADVEALRCSLGGGTYPAINTAAVQNSYIYA